MSTYILETRELHKNFGDNHAVQGISFGIYPKEIFSLLGPNGAGKSTTINMLCCLLEPTEGDAFIAEHSIRKDPMAVKRLIGVVPQDIALYPTLSARENLLFWGRMYGMGGNTLRKRVEEILEITGLLDRAKDRIETYSGGMKRRINIGVGLLHNPQIVFMDEPTVGIDPQSRRNILDTVKQLNERGMTVLYTTHYMEEAEELSNRIGIIDHGKLISIGTLAELTKLIGEDEVIELSIADEQTSQRLLDKFQTVPGVHKVTSDNGTTRILAQNANSALPALITHANNLEIRITDISIQEPNLEAVFLHLTGRALRN